MDCWEVTGTWVHTKPAVVSQAKKKVVKEDSPRPRKKARKEAPAEASEEAPAEASEEVHSVARSEVTTTVGGLTKEDIKTMFKDIVDAMREWFGTCLKEIKYLSERVEAVEKKVGITTKRKGTLSQNTTSPPKPTIGPGSESVNGTNAGRKSLPEDKGPDVPADVPADKEDARYQEKRDVALTLCRAKSDRIRKLPASQQSPYTTNSTAKVIIPNKNLYPGYNHFAPIDKKKLKKLADWLKTCPHLHIDAWINVLKKRMCFLDHLFALQWRFNYKDFKDSEPDQNSLGRRLPVNYTNSHWIAMWISIPKRHIVVWDSICSSISPEELDVARAGDCGVYALNYIECHALGMPFSKKDFAKPNGKTMSDKMVVDIFKELPDAYEFENKDNDANLGAYEG
uniref:Ubiquitin-like protease family profile domain-containing protein n=1 Tax=Brassica oleracea var. oleracea TaxID=109376 RepID=A0A0D3BCM7_BRAOL